MGLGCNCEGMCAKCMGGKLIVFGVIVVLTAVYWKDYIWHVLGGLLVLKGVMKVAMPGGCGHCSGSSEVKKGKK